MHYILANVLIAALLGMRRARMEVVILVGALMAAFTIYFMHGSADYIGYLKYFACSQNQFCLKSGDLHFEYSFVVVSAFMHALFLKAGGVWVIAFYSTLGLAIKLIIMKKQARHFGVALFIYATYAWYVHEMTQIRIGLAIAFYWLAVLSFTRQRLVASLGAMAVAVFFHLSTVFGLVYLVLDRLQTSARRFFAISLVLTVVGAVLSDSQVLLGVILSTGFVDARIGVYSEAIGNIISSTNFLIVYYVASVATLGLYAYVVPDAEATRFETMGFRLACVGMVFFSFLYWIPTVGLRGLEFFMCFTPFVAGAAFALSRGLLVKAGLVVLAVAVFYNLVVRNGTRTDYVLPGQPQEQNLEL